MFHVTIAKSICSKQNVVLVSFQFASKLCSESNREQQVNQIRQTVANIQRSANMMTVEEPREVSWLFMHELFELEGRHTVL